MGRCPNHKKPSKNRYSHKSARRAKFLVKGDDMIHAALKDPRTENVKAPDADLPGLGQFYCIHCDRYFASTSVRDEHYATKRHRKRIKLMKGPAPHTDIDAMIAAGMGAPDNGPKLRGGNVAMFVD